MLKFLSCERTKRLGITLLMISFVVGINLIPLLVYQTHAAGAMEYLNNATSSGAIFGGTNQQSFVSMIKMIINFILSILGVIFVLLMIYAGFIWMVARGKEEDIEKAIDTIRAAIFGLIIILAAYGITEFVFNKLAATTVGSVN